MHRSDQPCLQETCLGLRSLGEAPGVHGATVRATLGSVASARYYHAEVDLAGLATRGLSHTAAMVEDIALATGRGVMSVHVFMTGDHSPTASTGWHQDPEDTLLLMLEGSKEFQVRTWRQVPELGLARSDS